jgi:hypothetical protein
LIHFSIQSNHLHAIVETEGQPALSRAMQGIGVRIARRVNERLRRRGAFFADRYHARALRTPREVRSALVYVLQNHKHHAKGVWPAAHVLVLDPISSAAYFDGFTRPVTRWPRSGFLPPKDAPAVSPKTWLLRVGWRRLGLIRPGEAPAS